MVVSAAVSLAARTSADRVSQIGSLAKSLQLLKRRNIPAMLTNALRTFDRFTCVGKGHLAHCRPQAAI